MVGDSRYWQRIKADKPVVKTGAEKQYTHSHRVPVADCSASSRTATNVRTDALTVTMTRSAPSAALPNVSSTARNDNRFVGRRKLSFNASDRLTG